MLGKSDNENFFQWPGISCQAEAEDFKIYLRLLHLQLGGVLPLQRLWSSPPYLHLRCQLESFSSRPGMYKNFKRHQLMDDGSNCPKCLPLHKSMKLSLTMRNPRGEDTQITGKSTTDRKVYRPVSSLLILRKEWSAHLGIPTDDPVRRGARWDEVAQK